MKRRIFLVGGLTVLIAVAALWHQSANVNPTALTGQMYDGACPSNCVLDIEGDVFCDDACLIAQCSFDPQNTGFFSPCDACCDSACKGNIFFGACYSSCMNGDGSAYNCTDCCGNGGSGETGGTGDTGDSGTITGDSGSDTSGDTGDTGDTGDSGTTAGDTGDSGSDTSGDTGDTGDTGTDTSGDTGDSGATTGDTGDTGSDTGGDSGSDTSGDTGDTGSATGGDDGGSFDPDSDPDPDPCDNVDCNDSNACTSDSCNDGVCKNTPLSCSDGDSCTTDSCSAGQCVNTTIESAECGTCENEPVCQEFSQPCFISTPNQVDDNGCITQCGTCILHPLPPYDPEKPEQPRCPTPICAPIPEGCSATDSGVDSDGCPVDPCGYTCPEEPECSDPPPECENIDTYRLDKNPDCKQTGEDACGCPSFHCASTAPVQCCSAENVCRVFEVQARFGEDEEQYWTETDWIMNLAGQMDGFDESASPEEKRTFCENIGNNNPRPQPTVQPTSETSGDTGSDTSGTTGNTGGTGADTAGDTGETGSDSGEEAEEDEECLALVCDAPPAGCSYDLTVEVEECTCPPLICGDNGSSSHSIASVSSIASSNPHDSCSDCVTSCNSIDGPTDIVPKQLCLSGCQKAFGDECVAAVCGGEDAQLCGDMTQCCSAGSECVRSGSVSDALEGLPEAWKNQALADCLSTAEGNPNLSSEACYFYECVGSGAAPEPDGNQIASSSIGVAQSSAGTVATTGGATGETAGDNTAENGIPDSGAPDDNKRDSENENTLPQEFVCGDGYINQSFEQCDDANLTEGDGCSSTCQIESARRRDTRSTTPPVCGDGLLQYGEQCDDSNTQDADGCSSSCALETGTGPVCGDVILTIGEECDYGSANRNSPNHCRPDCTMPVCGDGIVDDRLNEECDDGNVFDNDGCSATCFSEQRQIANVPDEVPTLVAAASICGNGVLEPGEQCDDGNMTSSDGCNRYCEITLSKDEAELGKKPSAPSEEQEPETQTLVAGESETSNSAPTGAYSQQNLQLPNMQGALSQPGQVAYQQPVYGFPSYPNYQNVSYRLPLAQLQPLVQGTAPVGDTGPAAVAVMGAGMAAGVGWMRRKRR